MDFATANTSNPAGASVRLGNGSFVFASASSILSSSAYETIANDFNRDGKQDLAIVNRNSNGTVSIYNGAGDGTFNSPIGSPFSVGNFSEYITSADFNSDNIEPVNKFV